MPSADAQILAQGRIQYTRMIGAGGTGVVYEAVDHASRTRIALKRLTSQRSEAIGRLKNEFLAFREIVHPNLVQLGELFEEEGTWFFTMELVEGQDFVSFVRQSTQHDASGDEGRQRSVLPRSDGATGFVSRVRSKTQLVETRLRPALRKLVEAVDFVHQAGRLHRNIKPSNVLVTQEGRVVLMDFGMVSNCGPEGPSSPGRAELVGTAQYAAPELALGLPGGRSADWYSVGVVLYEALTGHGLLDGPPVHVLVQQLETVPPNPICLAPEAPRDLVTLCVELLQADPSLRPTGTQILVRTGVPTDCKPESILPPSSPSRVPVFVGRGPELAALKEAFETTKRQRTTIAMIVEGESGIGKSSLVGHFQDFVRGSDPSAVILSGQCYERETVPFNALDGVVDVLARYMSQIAPEYAASLLPSRPTNLVGTFPALDRVKVIQAATRQLNANERDPQEQRVRLFSAMRQLVVRLADRHPLIISIDDFHWADADSVALLSEIMRSPDEPALLFVATVRVSDDGSTKPSRAISLTSPAEIRRLSVGKLTAEEARDLAETLMVDPAVGPRFELDAIAREAQGHPLFIHELANHVAVHAHPSAPSMRLDDVIAARVAKLPSAAQRILELAAVAGQPIGQTVLSQASGVAPQEFEGAMTTLRIGRLLHATAGHDTRLLSVYHGRVRDAVARGLDAQTVREHHRALADALESADTNEPERLALHLRDAGELRKASGYAIEAARTADKALAFDHAAHLYKMALDLCEISPEAARDILVKQARALGNAGRGPEAAQAYLQAAAQTPAPKAIGLRRRAADHLLRSGHIDEGLTELRIVLAAMGIRFAKTPFHALVSLLLFSAWVRLRGLGFRERGAETIPRLVLARIDTYWTTAATMGQVDFVRGADFGVRALLMALRVGEPQRVVQAIAVGTAFVASAGGASRARTNRFIAVLGSLAARYPAPPFRALVAFSKTLDAYFLGRWVDVETCGTEAIEILENECSGVSWELATVSFYRHAARSYMGKMADLAVGLPRDVANALSRGDLYYATNLRLGMSNPVWLASDDVQAAARIIHEATKGWSQQGFHVQHFYGTMARVQLNLYAGRVHDAQAVIADSLPGLAQSYLRRVQVVRVQTEDLRARAAVALAMQDWEQRETLLQDASYCAERLAREKVPWALGLGKLVLAGIAACRLDESQAKRHLESAVQRFEASDMALHAAVARRRLGTIVGGTQGQEWVRAADQWMEERTMKNPSRWTAMLAPGFLGD